MDKHRIAPDKGNSFYFAIDGEPAFLIGATHENGWTAISDPAHNYLRDFDRLKKTVDGIGSVHIRGLVRLVSSFAKRGFMQPYVIDADGLYDLTSFNPEWERRFKDILDAAYARGLIVSLELWDDCSQTFGAESAYSGHNDIGWPFQPFNPDNNCNYGPTVLSNKTGSPVVPFYDVLSQGTDNNPVLTLQQRFADKYVELAGAYPNIIFSLSNETRATTAWSSYWAAYLRERLPATALISEMPSTDTASEDGEWDPALSPAYVVTGSAYDVADLAQLLNSHSLPWEGAAQAVGAGIRTAKMHALATMEKTVKPLMSSKDYSNTQEQGVPVIWAKFISGCATARFHRSYAPMDPRTELNSDFQFRQIGVLGAFIARIPFWEMGPDRILVTSFTGMEGCNALGNGKNHYLVQVIGNRAGRLTVGLAAGDWTAAWFDGKTGSKITEQKITPVDGSACLTTPDTSPDIILEIVQ